MIKLEYLGKGFYRLTVNGTVTQLTKGELEELFNAAAEELEVHIMYKGK